MRTAVLQDEVRDLDEKRVAGPEICIRQLAAADHQLLLLAGELSSKGALLEQA